MKELEVAKKYGIELSESQLEAFEIYYSLLIEWNNKFNLTAITDRQGVAEKHFLDSLLGAKHFHGKICDVGSGAGFPALPLAIFNPSLSVFMIDSLNKRVNFLNEVCAKLNLQGKALHFTAEEASSPKQLRESFDVVTARAVAPMDILPELTAPLVKVGGSLVLYKGQPSPEDEQGAKDAEKYGCTYQGKEEFVLPDGSKRTIYLFKKTKHTPNQYPRKGLRKKGKK